MKKKRKFSLGIALPALMLISMCIAAAAGTGTEHDQRMKWWRAARFGLFIHWGLYSIPAGEWGGKTGYGEWIRNNAQIPIGQYDRFIGVFNPVKFNAGEWVRLAREAGMKYIVITTKHHDGFCLFDSQYTDFDVMSTPFKRDIMKELADACRGAGLKMCWYYSIMDWHHPDYLPRRDWEKDRPTGGADFARYVQYMKNQVAELLARYGPMGVLWFDGEWESTWNSRLGREMYDHVRSLQLAVIVNNRVGPTSQDLVGMNRSGRIGDFGTPEQQVPATGLPGVDWETCMTTNDNWGYNKADNNWKPAGELIRLLVDIVSKGGNFLLNVGPTAEGVFPQPAVDRLHEIGRWMKVNGEAIYGTQASPFEDLSWGRCTQKPIGGDTRLFLHVFDWPADGKLPVPELNNEPLRAFLLSDPHKNLLKIQRHGNGLEISLPEKPVDPYVSVTVLDVKGKPAVDRLKNPG